MAKALTRLTKKVFRVQIEFVTACQEYHGLTNGYLDPTLLGADRWLALIGAWTKARSALCVGGRRYPPSRVEQRWMPAASISAG